MASLYDRFRELLRSPTVQQGIDTVHRAYRNEQSLYRARNRRPRTELMVKGIPGSVFTDRGMIAQVAWIEVSELKNLDGTKALFEGPNFDRYHDIACYIGQWWTGERWSELIVEVENDWSELRGTLRDILSSQARRKWAVFYHSNLPAAAAELSNAVTEVWGHFRAQGFCENENTRYEVLVLPDHDPKFVGELTGSECAVYEFTAAEVPLSRGPKIVRL